MGEVNKNSSSSSSKKGKRKNILELDWKMLLGSDDDHPPELLTLSSSSSDSQTTTRLKKHHHHHHHNNNNNNSYFSNPPPITKNNLKPTKFILQNKIPLDGANAARLSSHNPVEGLHKEILQAPNRPKAFRILGDFHATREPVLITVPGGDSRLTSGSGGQGNEPINPTQENVPSLGTAGSKPTNHKIPLKKNSSQKDAKSMESLELDSPAVGDTALRGSISGASAKSTRLIYAEACKNFLINSVPPEEKLYVQNLQVSEKADNIATSLTTLVTHYADVLSALSCTPDHIKTLTEEKQQWELEKIHMSQVIADMTQSLAQERNQWNQEKERHSQTISSLNQTVEEVLTELASVIEERSSWSAKLEAEKSANLKLGQEKDEEIKKLQVLSEQLKGEFEVLKASSEGLNAQLQVRDGQLAQLNGEFQTLTATIASLNARVASLEADRRWLITDGIPRAFEAIRDSQEFRDKVLELVRAADILGRQDGIREGYSLCQGGKLVGSHSIFNINAVAKMADAEQAMSDTTLPIIYELTATADEVGIMSLRNKLRGFGSDDKEVEEGNAGDGQAGGRD